MTGLKVADRGVEAFLAKIHFKPGCWTWTANTNGLGYGRVSVDGRKQYAHRVAYEFWNGPIPDGLVIDHLCKNPSCVRPTHLEAVTQKENLRRGDGVSGAGSNANKTRCVNGHPFDEGNTYLRPRGGRDCRSCTREKQRRLYHERRAAAAA